MEDKRKEFIASIKKINILKLIYKICTITCVLLLIAAIVLIYTQPRNNILYTIFLIIVLFLMITIFVLFYVLNHYNKKFGGLRDKILLDKKEG